jgi:hypothetical protein
MSNSKGTKKARGSKKNRKYKRNEAKCKSYRLRMGKPHKTGNKRGKNAS